MKDRSNDPSHHERTLLPRSYILLPRETVSKHFFEVTFSSEALPGKTQQAYGLLTKVTVFPRSRLQKHYHRRVTTCTQDGTSKRTKKFVGFQYGFHWPEREIAPWRINPMTQRTMSERSYQGATSCTCGLDSLLCFSGKKLANLPVSV